MEVQPHTAARSKGQAPPGGTRGSGRCSVKCLQSRLRGLYVAVALAASPPADKLMNVKLAVEDQGDGVWSRRCEALILMDAAIAKPGNLHFLYESAGLSQSCTAATFSSTSI